MTDVTNTEDSSTPTAVEAQNHVPCYTRRDLFRVLYGVKLAEIVKSRGLAGVRYMDEAQGQQFGTKEHFTDDINLLLEFVLPFKSLEIDDFAVIATLAWTYWNAPSERVERKLWHRVERMRDYCTTEQLSLLQRLKDCTLAAPNLTGISEP